MCPSMNILIGSSWRSSQVYSTDKVNPLISSDSEIDGKESLPASLRASALICCTARRWWWVNEDAKGFDPSRHQFLEYVPECVLGFRSPGVFFRVLSLLPPCPLWSGVSFSLSVAWVPCSSFGWQGLCKHWCRHLTSGRAPIRRPC